MVVDELDQIVAMSQERLYKWLHSLAGLVLDFTQTEDQTSLGKKPSFSYDVSQVGHLVSTKSIVQRLWQRLLSA